MIIRKLRIEKGWSQEQLAEFSGLSVRTIQRLERGKSSSLESLKSVAAVFEINVSELKQESVMNKTSKEELAAVEYVRDIKGFYSHLINYVIIISGLCLINLIFTPKYYWFLWAALGWGIGIISHALSVFEIFNFFGANWEKKQIEKRLRKKI